MRPWGSCGRCGLGTPVALPMIIEEGTARSHRRIPMALIDLETALSRNNSLQSAQPPSFEAVICISAVEKLISSPAHQPAVPARRPLLLAKLLRGFAGQLLRALHESRRASLTQLGSGGANND